MSIQLRSPNEALGIEAGTSRDQPLVSIIVVTYGTGPIVLDTLDSVAQHTTVDHEVIVVDCLPSDPSTRTAPLLAGRADVRLLAVDDNLGFAGGNEYGVEHAHGEYLCFLNPDVIVGAGWLEPLIAALEDPAVGIAAPVFLDEDGSLQEAGQLIFADTFTAPIGGPGVMEDDRTNIFSRDVDYASAACWLVRRADHLQLGGFDRHYHPAYFEDSDYALRMEATGRRTRLVADVPVVHRRGQGTGTRSATLGQVTHARFKRRWEVQLADRPCRPSTVGCAIAARDRLAGATTLYIAWSDESTVEDRTAGLERAVSAAQAAPRDRVIFLTDVPPPSPDGDRARIAGLEVVVVGGDRGGVEAERITMADEVVRVGTPAPPVRFRGPLTWLTVAVGFVAGVAIRWLLFDTPAAAMNADEAYVGIEAFEIVGGHLPVVLGGTVYTLPLEAYFYALFRELFSQDSFVVLKLLTTFWWAATGVVLYFVGRRLASKRAGFIAAALCWVAPGALMILSIGAFAAYASGMLVVTLGFLTAVRIMDAVPPGPSRVQTTAFGILAGFAFWLHPMFFTVMVPMAVVVLWTVRRRLDGWLTVIGGAIAGCLPLLLWNAVNGWPSLETPVKVPGTYTDRLHSFAFDLLPRAFGLKDSGLNWYGEVWGPALYLLLLATAGFGLWSIARRSTARGRVVLFVVLGSVFFLMALLPNLIYANDGRYAMISFPFLLIALGAGIDRLAGQKPPWRVIGVLALVATIWMVGFVRPNTQPFLDQRGVDPNAQLDEIVDLLDERGIDRIYGDYWAVLPVDFAGDNRIVGAVFPFWPIRFPERQRTVGASPPENIAVIYMGYDENLAYLLMPVDRYERIVVGDRVVYLPLAAADDSASAMAPTG